MECFIHARFVCLCLCVYAWVSSHQSSVHIGVPMLVERERERAASATSLVSYQGRYKPTWCGCNPLIAALTFTAAWAAHLQEPDRAAAATAAAAAVFIHAKPHTGPSMDRHLHIWAVFAKPQSPSLHLSLSLRKHITVSSPRFRAGPEIISLLFLTSLPTFPRHAHAHTLTPPPPCPPTSSARELTFLAAKWTSVGETKSLNFVRQEIRFRSCTQGFF